MESNNTERNEPYAGFQRDDINWAGLGGLLGFFALVLSIGIYASWKSKAFKSNYNIKDIALAGRNIGPFMGIMTMTASWLGGGFLNGNAEIIFTPGQGLSWDTPLWTYALGLLIGGVIFAKKMRQAEYVTFLDPFHERFGIFCTTLCFIPACLGDIFYSACILSALGATLTVIIGIKHSLSVIISVGVVIIYTLLGGLYSVAYTDIIQLLFILFGLCIAIPFAITHPAVGPIGETALGFTGWLGTIETPYIAMWIDSVFQLTLGGIPIQGYFQRVLSSRSPRLARTVSVVACLGLLTCSILPITIGAIAKSTDWNATDYRFHGKIPVPEIDYKFILPFVMEFLTPLPISIIALGAVSAAVMSSADSAVLSGSCLFTINVYEPVKKAILKKKGVSLKNTQDEIWVLRVGIIILGCSAAAMAIYVQSIFGLLFLCSDLLYVVLFPQLLCAVHIPISNSYGSLMGWLLAAVLRILSGEPFLSFSPIIKYPWYDETTGTQLFPFKTFIMLLSLFTIVAVSLLSNILFTKEFLPIEMDVFNCFTEGDKRSKQTPHLSGNEGEQSNNYELVAMKPTI